MSQSITDVLAPFIERLHQGALTSDAATQLGKDITDAVAAWESKQNSSLVPESPLPDGIPELPSPEPLPPFDEPTEPPLPSSPLPFPPVSTNDTLALAQSIVDLSNQLVSKANELIGKLNVK